MKFLYGFEEQNLERDCMVISARYFSRKGARTAKLTSSKISQRDRILFYVSKTLRNGSLPVVFVLEMINRRQALLCLIFPSYLFYIYD